jgi:hypothetical protein
MKVNGPGRFLASASRKYSIYPKSGAWVNIFGSTLPGRADFSSDLKQIIGQYDRVRDMGMESPLASANLSDESAC